MGRNLTQPEEIDHILLEIAGRDMRTDTPDYPLNPDCSLGQIQRDLPVSVRPESRRVCFYSACGSTRPLVLSEVEGSPRTAS